MNADRAVSSGLLKEFTSIKSIAVSLANSILQTNDVSKANQVVGLVDSFNLAVRKFNAVFKSTPQSEVVLFNAPLNGDLMRRWLLEVMIKSDYVIGIIEEVGKGKGSVDMAEFEGGVKELINFVMTRKYGESWFENKEAVPPHIVGKVLKNLDKNNISDRGRAYTEMTFGNCCEIIRINKLLFFPVFMGGEHGFGNWEELEGALAMLSRVRNTQGAHSSSAERRVEDAELVGLYVGKIEEVIRATLHPQ